MVIEYNLDEEVVELAALVGYQFPVCVRAMTYQPDRLVIHIAIGPKMDEVLKAHRRLSEERWSHCGNQQPHKSHLHTISFPEGTYGTLCLGVPDD